MKLYLVDDDEMKEASLEDLARWWVHQYPADVFVENPIDIVAIRNHFDNILMMLNDGKRKRKIAEVGVLERGV